MLGHSRCALPLIMWTLPLLSVACGPTPARTVTSPPCGYGTTWDGTYCIAAMAPRCPISTTWSGSACIPSPPAAPSPATAASQATTPFEVSLRPDGPASTVAGLLQVVELERGCAYEVRLREQPVMNTNCKSESRFSAYPMPQLLKHYSHGVEPFEQVVVVQQHNMGNACNGGPLWFLGLKQDGSHVISTSIDHCGGRDPVIRPEPGRIVVLLPGGPPNRGDGYIPAQTWEFRRGVVRRTDSNNR